VRYFKEMKIIVASPKAMCKFKKGKEGAYYYDTGEEKNGIVYSTSTKIKYSPAFLEFTHWLDQCFEEAQKTK